MREGEVNFMSLFGNRDEEVISWCCGKWKGSKVLTFTVCVCVCMCVCVSAPQL